MMSLDIICILILLLLRLQYVYYLFLLANTIERNKKKQSIIINFQNF